MHRRANGRGHRRRRLLQRDVSVNRTRSVLYSLARFLGDYQAVKNGRVGKCIANKVIGRNVVRRLWR